MSVPDERHVLCVHATPLCIVSVSYYRFWYPWQGFWNPSHRISLGDYGREQWLMGLPDHETFMWSSPVDTWTYRDRTEQEGR